MELQLAARQAGLIVDGALAHAPHGDEVHTLGMWFGRRGPIIIYLSRKNVKTIFLRKQAVPGPLE